MNIISGKDLSARIKDELADKIGILKENKKRVPGLSVILVGDNPASRSYVKSKANGCAQVGIENRTITLPADISQEELEAVVEQENQNPEVDGILVQLPLPAHLNEQKVIEKIAPDKDVDGLHTVNAGKLLTGQKGLVPCTPKGVMYILESLGYNDLSGLNAVVLGRSNLVGKPLAQLLQQKNATVTTIHSRTKEPEKIAANADIVIAAIGVPEKIDAGWIKDGAVVIDVGINRVDGKLKGDVAFDAVKEKAKAITPVPGGVGLLTVAMLLSNTLEAYEMHERKD